MPSAGVTPDSCPSHLARLENNLCVDGAFWESMEHCQVAIEHAAGVPEIAEWPALIEQDLSMISA